MQPLRKRNHLNRNLTYWYLLRKSVVQIIKKDSIGLETRWLRDEAEKASPVIEEVQTSPGAHPWDDKHRNFSLEVDDDITNVHREIV